MVHLYTWYMLCDVNKKGNLLNLFKKLKKFVPYNGFPTTGREGSSFVCTFAERHERDLCGPIPNPCVICALYECKKDLLTSIWMKIKVELPYSKSAMLSEIELCAVCKKYEMIL